MLTSLAAVSWVLERGTYCSGYGLSLLAFLGNSVGSIDRGADVDKHQ